MLNLKKVSSLLISKDISQIEVECILNEIHVYFQKLTNLHSYDLDFKYKAPYKANIGVALGLYHAAHCILDYKRTVYFLKGIVNAIHDKQKINPNKVINIFYAGCGPYAPFITLVAPLFQRNEIQFSLLEINKDSLDLAKKIITTLGQSDYVKKHYLADAVTFKIPSPKSYDILISETLNVLLSQESYVPILWNVLPQLSKHIIVIPENVCIKINFQTNEKRTKQSKNIKEYYAGKVFDVRQALKPYYHDISLPSNFQSKAFILESEYIIVDTEVNVYNGLLLTRGECNLTIPFKIINRNDLNKKIIFTYYLTPQVELKHEFQ